MDTSCPARERTVGAGEGEAKASEHRRMHAAEPMIPCQARYDGTVEWFAADKARYRNLAAAWVTPGGQALRPVRHLLLQLPHGARRASSRVARRAGRRFRVPHVRRVRQALPQRSAAVRADERLGRCERGSADGPESGDGAAGGGQALGRGGQSDAAGADRAQQAEIGRGGGAGPRRHVLVGGGPATLAAAQAIRGADADAEIVVVCGDPHGFYSRPGLAYYLTGELPERRLSAFSPAELRSLGIDWIGETAAGIEPAAHEVVLEAAGGSSMTDCSWRRARRPSAPRCRGRTWTAS